MKEFLKTERLILRNLYSSDAGSVFTWRNDAQCAKYQRWEDTTYQRIDSYIQRHCEDRFLSEKEEQHYMITAHNGEPVGELAYFYTKDDCITLGITISTPHQQLGYAFELLSAVICAIMSTYPTLDIVGLIDPENRASIRLFEKLCFVRECYVPSIHSLVYTLHGK